VYSNNIVQAISTTPLGYWRTSANKVLVNMWPCGVFYQILCKTQNGNEVLKAGFVLICSFQPFTIFVNVLIQINIEPSRTTRPHHPPRSVELVPHDFMTARKTRLHHPPRPHRVAFIRGAFSCHNISYQFVKITRLFRDPSSETSSFLGSFHPSHPHTQLKKHTASQTP
jgi:hypothetical protein